MNDKLMIEAEIEKHLDKIKEIDNNFFGCGCGVAEAIGRTHEALDDINRKMAARKYSESSMLGYGDITSNFIFLQRTLGAMQTAYDDKTKLVSEIAHKTKKAYEEVEPFVDAKLSSMVLREENMICPEEAKKRIQKILNRSNDDEPQLEVRDD